MLEVNRRLSDKEIELLSNLKGRAIESIQGAFRFDEADVWNTLRIIANGLAIDINLFQESLPSSDEEDSYDETGVFSIVPSQTEHLIVDAVPLEVKTKKIAKEVKGINIYESDVKYFENSIQYFQMVITKSIAFELDDTWLVLDRKVWFDEAITVSFCEKPEDGIRNDADDWQNGSDETDFDGLTMEYQLICREI